MSECRLGGWRYLVGEMGEPRCTCGRAGQACNGGERLEPIIWNYHVGIGMAERTVDYLVGKPRAGEDRDEAGLRVLKSKLVESSVSCDPATVTWEEEMIARSLLLGKASVREAVIALLESLGWRPRELLEVEGVDCVYSRGRLVPLIPAEEQLPLRQRGWPTSAPRGVGWPHTRCSRDACIYSSKVFSG